MRPTVESRLSAVGCAALMIGFAALVHLAFTTHWKYAVGAVGLLVAWIGVMQLLRYRDQRRERAALHRIFSAAGIAPPRYETGASYGFPTFKITFEDASAMKRAEEAGCIDGFKNWLQSAYAHLGEKENPFDIERAFSVTFES